MVQADVIGCLTIQIPMSDQKQETTMKQFRSIEKIDTGILYVLELTSSISILLLAFGLIASMANVLTQGSVLTDNVVMQRVWAWTQYFSIKTQTGGKKQRKFVF